VTCQAENALLHDYVFGLNQVNPKGWTKMGAKFGLECWPLKAAGQVADGTCEV